MKIMQVAFVFAGLFHIPITLYPAREQIYLFYRVERTFLKHFFTTVALTLFSVAIPCVYPDITGLLGILGGITVGGSGYYLPLLLKIISLFVDKEKFYLKVFYIVVLVCALVIGLGSTYVSLTTGQSVGH